jgi:hypothetical protein
MIHEKWNLMLPYLNDPMNHVHWNKFDKSFKKQKKKLFFPCALDGNQQLMKERNNDSFIALKVDYSTFFNFIKM